jgi:anthranilate phosphoribosyltransferase
MLLGVYDEYLVETLAKVLSSLGVKRGMVVYGMDKLDEISMSAPTKICEIKDGWYRSYIITPEQFGFERCSKEELEGGTPEENARTTRGILSGEIRDARRTSVLMNAGCGLYAGNAAASIEEGIKIAADMIDSGKALAVLDAYIAASNRAV